MNGNDIIVYWDGTPIAAVKSDSINTGAETIETSSATNGQWRTYITGRKEWSLKVNYLVLANSGVRDLLKVGTTYTIKVKGRGATDASGVTGSAILTDCTIQATRGNLVTGSFDFKGDGALT